MTPELAVRLADVALALLFLWLLAISLAAGRLCGRRGFQWDKRERPSAYWMGIFLLALMVLHFGGLAWVGQKLG